MIHSFMWQYPELFTTLVCGSAAIVAVAICVACFSVKQDVSDE